jgi:hypothetical protein
MEAFFANSKTAVVKAHADEFTGTFPELENIAKFMCQYNNVADCHYAFNDKVATIVYTFAEDVFKYAEGLLLDPAKRDKPKEDLRHQLHDPGQEKSEEDLKKLFLEQGLTPRQEVYTVEPGEEISDEDADKRIQLFEGLRKKRITEEATQSESEVDKEIQEELHDINKDLTEVHPITHEKYEESYEEMSPEKRLQRLKKIKEIAQAVKKIPPDKIPPDLKAQIDKIKKDVAFEDQIPLNRKFRALIEEELANYEESRGISLSDAQKKKVTEAYLNKWNMNPEFYWQWIESLPSEEETADEAEAGKLASEISMIFKTAAENVLDTLMPGQTKKIVSDLGDKQEVKKKIAPGSGDESIIVKDTNTGEEVAYNRDDPKLEDINKGTLFNESEISL